MFNNKGIIFINYFLTVTKGDNAGNLYYNFPFINSKAELFINP